MSRPTIHLPAGWRMAFDGEHEGRTWIVSPFITSSGPSLAIRKGDRILVRGRIQDVAGGATDADALVRLQEAGAEIKALAHLHAKVYVRETGAQQVAWIGSANLTGNGEGVSGFGNVEAMAGPFVTDDLLPRLEGLWKKAVELDPYALKKRALDAMQESASDLAYAYTGGFLVATIRKAMLQNSLAMRRDWYLPDHTQDRRPGKHSVSLVEGGAEAYGRWRRYANEVVNRLKRADVLHTGMPGQWRFLVATEDGHRLSRVLDEANALLRREALHPEDRESLQTDLDERVETVLQRLITPPAGLRAPDSMTRNAMVAKGRAAARKRLDRYLRAGPFRLRYELSIPVDTNEPRLRRSMAAWKREGARVQGHLDFEAKDEEVTRIARDAFEAARQA